jgi:hypothetical protein
LEELSVFSLSAAGSCDPILESDPQRLAAYREEKEVGMMIRRLASILGIFGTVVALAAVFAPAVGASSATITLTAGALSISAPSGSVSLGSSSVSNGSITISGSLGVVSISDARGVTTPWTASVISTAFTPPAGPAIPASDVSYAAGVITQSAGVVATAVAATDLTGVTTVVTGVPTGVSSVSWNPTITIVVPANYAPGVYAATITHSVA